MPRIEKEKLEKIKQSLGVSELWSWSRYHAIETDLYGYFLKYVKRAKPDRFDGRYGQSGSSAHEILEKLYLGEIKYEDMYDEWLTSVMYMDMSGLKYNRADEEKNRKIADKYEYCVGHFFKSHNIVKAKPSVEEFILVKVGDYFFQGYVDFMHNEIVFDEDGNETNMLYITDFKTSTIYTGQKAINECGQLLLYAEAMHQRTGIPYENIRIRWNFLKYITVGEPTAKGEIKYRNIERNQIGEKLVTKAKLHLKKAGYNEEEIAVFLDKMIEDNSIDCLPDEVKSKYTFDDCYVELVVKEEDVVELLDEMVEAIERITSMVKEYNITKNDGIFCHEIKREDEYFYYNLCDYSRKLHKPWDAYLNEINMFAVDQNSDVPMGMGNMIDTAEDDDEDLSWLDEFIRD